MRKYEAPSIFNKRDPIEEVVCERCKFAINDPIFISVTGRVSIIGTETIVQAGHYHVKCFNECFAVLS